MFLWFLKASEVPRCEDADRRYHGSFWIVRVEQEFGAIGDRHPPCLLQTHTLIQIENTDLRMNVYTEASSLKGMCEFRYGCVYVCLHRFS